MSLHLKRTYLYHNSISLKFTEFFNKAESSFFVSFFQFWFIFYPSDPDPWIRHIVADLDPGSQNLLDPKHWTLRLQISVLLSMKTTSVFYPPSACIGGKRTLQEE